MVEIMQKNKGLVIFLAGIAVVTAVFGLVVGILSWIDSRISVEDLTVTNVTDTAFTVTWVSDSPYIGRVVYQEESKGWSPLFAQLGKEVAYDDRDIELNSDGEYVQVEGGATERYTHHVTIRDLDPETQYEFRIAGVFNGKTPLQNIASTMPLIEDIQTPDPAYGLVEGIEAENDTIIIFTDVNSSIDENPLTSSPLSIDNTYSFDTNLFANDIESASSISMVIKEKNYRAVDHVFTGDDYKPLDTLVIEREDQEISRNILDNVSKDINAIVNEDADESSESSNEIRTTEVDEDGNTGGIILPEGCPEGGTISKYNTVSGVNIRSKTSSSGEKLGFISHPSSFNGCEQKEQGEAPYNDGRNTWVKVQLTNGETGYVWEGALSSELKAEDISQDTDSDENKEQQEEVIVKEQKPMEINEDKIKSEERSIPIVIIDEKNNSTNDWMNGFSGDTSKRRLQIIDFANQQSVDENVIISIDNLMRNITNGEVYDTTDRFDKKYFEVIREMEVTKILRYINWLENPDLRPAINNFLAIEYPSYHQNFLIVLLLQTHRQYDVSVYPLVSDLPTELSQIPNGLEFKNDDRELFSMTSSEFLEKINNQDKNLELNDLMSHCRRVFNDDNAELTPRSFYEFMYEDRDTSYKVGTIYAEYFIVNDDTSDFNLDFNPYYCVDNNEIIDDNNVNNTEIMEIFEPTNDCQSKFIDSVTARQLIASEEAFRTAEECNGANSLLNSQFPLTPISAQETPGSQGAVLQADDDGLTVEESGNYAFFSDEARIAEQNIVVVDGEVRVRLFTDTNGNGQKDEDEEYFDDYSQIQVRKEASLETFQLSAGWNLIHIPLVDQTADAVRTAGDLIDEWNSQGADIKHVARFRNGQFEMFSKRESGTEYSRDFDLVPGQGLFVLNYAGNITTSFAGNVVDQSLPVRLNQGWNLVGLYNPDEDLDTEIVFNKAGEQSVGMRTISQFENGQYQSVISEDGLVFGNNFNVIGKRGYFIRVEGGSETEFTP
jgi:hypothetical protein